MLHALSCGSVDGHLDMYHVCAALQENVTLDGDDLLGDCLDQLSSVGVFLWGIVLQGDGLCTLM